MDTVDIFKCFDQVNRKLIEALAKEVTRFNDELEKLFKINEEEEKKEEPKPQMETAKFGNKSNSDSDSDMDEELYNRRALSFCECDSDELDGDLNLSDDEE